MTQDILIEEKNSFQQPKDYFPEIIGQEKVKKNLSLYLDGYKVNKFIPPILLISPRGTGKTNLASQLSNNLTDNNNQIKNTLHINCASIKNLSQFVDQLIIPFQNTYVTYLMDEIHCVPKDVSNWLLSVISPNKERKSFNYFNNNRFDFDFHQTSWLACTTHPEKLSEAYKSRQERIDLEEYSDSELIRILYKNSGDIIYKDNIELDIVSVCRSTPREVVKISDKIKQYCDIKHNRLFDKGDWSTLKNRAGINYLGLNAHEIRHLQCLKESGELTLTMLAAKLRLDRTTVQRDIERFLFEKSLINIEGKRFLTHLGREAIKCLETDKI